jgi:Tol biopolymer transport system component
MGPEKKPGTWSFSLVGEEVRKLRDDNDWSVPSLDGSLVAVARDNAIWVMEPDGENPRKLVSAEKGRWIDGPEWSPDGRRLAYRNSGPEGTAIESRNLGGGPPVTIVPSNPSLGDWSWTSDGIVYLLTESPPNENSNNFWEVKVDPTGRPISAPRRISKWLGYWHSDLRRSADGKRLAYLKGHSHSNVYVAQLEGGGTQVTKDVQQLTFDIHVDWFSAWTPDGKAALFYSDRRGNFDIFRESLGNREAEPVAVSPQEERDPQISPDGSWIVYFAYNKARDGLNPSTGRIMRVPISGGQPQFVAEVNGYAGCANCSHLDPGRHPALRCPKSPNALCVLSEVKEGRIVFASLDIAAGRKSELFRVDAKDAGAAYWDAYWDLSPDGSRIAFSAPNDTNCEIRIMTLTGVTERTLSVKGRTRCIAVAWPQRGEGLFVEAYTDVKSTLLRASPDGDAKPLRTSLKWFQHFAESPDGKHLAFTDVVGDSNAWMIENY